MPDIGAKIKIIHQSRLCYPVNLFCKISRLTIVSRETKKKQAIHDERVNYFTGSTAVKFVNILNNPRALLKLCIYRLDSACSN